jgi:Extracellular link domain
MYKNRGVTMSNTTDTSNNTSHIQNITQNQNVTTQAPFVFAKPTTTTSTPNTTNISSSASLGVQSVFSKANIVLFVCFSLLYILLYGMMYLVLGGNIADVASSWFIDIFLFLIFAFYIFYYYFSKTETQLEDDIGSFFVWIRDALDAPSSFFSIILIMVLFYMLMYILRVPMGDNKPYSILFIEGHLWVFLVLDIFGLVFNYLFGFSVIDLLLNPIISAWYTLPANSSNPVDISGGVVKDASATTMPALPTTTVPPKKEVFNVNNNLYTYDDAQAICKNYGARLANYDEVEESYNDGGEWCNYGWSSNQMALFPTQKNTWNKLQQTDKHKNDCGRPGINGGYIANPYAKFGVNCYGVKPKPGPKDLSGNRMNYVDRMLNDGKPDTLNKDLVLNSFNYNKWSEHVK